MRTRTAVLVAATVLVTVAAAAVFLEAGHRRLYADRHRIELKPRPRRSCPDCRGVCGCWSERRELHIRLLPVPAWLDEPPF
ncbi:hypothetical protein ABZ383_00585 [Streptomyces sp. NPDC005900]|uniref:hypothetical protein n=1 Tax=Streptomyces sp. NPDC005900 TaxID=3154569 RepID=UPI0033EF0E38